MLLFNLFIDSCTHSNVYPNSSDLDGSPLIQGALSDGLVLLDEALVPSLNGAELLTLVSQRLLCTWDLRSLLLRDGLRHENTLFDAPLYVRLLAKRCQAFPGQPVARNCPRRRKNPLPRCESKEKCRWR